MATANQVVVDSEMSLIITEKEYDTFAVTQG